MTELFDRETITEERGPGAGRKGKTEDGEVRGRREEV